MLRSLIESARGRSAGGGGAEKSIFDSRLPAALPPSAVTPTPSSEFPRTSAHSQRPAHCCVYCGHAIYVGPRVQRVRCPKCSAELPVLDVLLQADQTADRILTAGKIIIFPEVRIAAELVACVVEISGMVLGDVLASQTCRVTASGKVAGRILCRYLELAPGAQVNGEVELVQS